jgi:hypothetical protein
MLPTKFRFILPSSFRGEDLKKSANQKQELPVVAMFVNGSEQMSTLYKGPSIDASYQVSVHLAEEFQRRRLKCEKLTDDGRRMPSDGKSSHCLWQGELNMTRHTNFLLKYSRKTIPQTILYHKYWHFCCCWKRSCLWCSESS